MLRRAYAVGHARLGFPVNFRLTILSVLILASCSLDQNVSNVVVPGAGIGVAVVEDEKSLYRYCIHRDEKKCTGGRVFGTRGGQRPKGAPLPNAIVTRSGDVATITWPGTSLHIEIDAIRGMSISDSNLAK
jgi:hypothetical protein